MRIQKSAIVILLILTRQFSYCQEDSLKSMIKRTSNLTIGFNSSLIYPGATAGIELPIAETNITKSIKNGEPKRFIRSQFLTSNLSWYHHPHFHDNVYFTFGWTNRRTRTKGLITEFSPGMGYSRTFLGGTTYQVDDNGGATIIKSAGYSYALILIGGGIGYDFSVAGSKPFIFIYRLNLLAMFPYNSTIYLRPAMEIGLVYKPKHFLPAKVRTKRISK